MIISNNYLYGQKTLNRLCTCHLTIFDGTGGAGTCTLGVTIAEIALGNFAGAAVVVDGAVGAGHGAHFAPNAFGVVHNLCAERMINTDCVGWAGLHAPGLFTLGAGVGDIALTVLEFKDFDAGLRRIEATLMLQ